MKSSWEMKARDGSYHKVDFVSLVEVLQDLSSLELSKLIRDSEQIITSPRKPSQLLRIEDLGMLPMHLMGRLVEADQDEDEAFFKQLLSWLTILHKVYFIAPQHLTLKQIFLDDRCASRQSFDMIFYILATLNKLTKATQCSYAAICLRSTIVASGLHLFKECVSPDWPEVADSLSNHPKCSFNKAHAYRLPDLSEAVFVAVHVDIELLQKLLSVHVSGSLEMTKHQCQQCEASLQCIHALCQDKSFQDYLVKHKILYGKDGFLLLVQCALSLNVSTSVVELEWVTSAVSRIKSKVLSMLSHLCEIDSLSYLDEVAKSPGGLKIAQTVALEVIELLKTLFGGRRIEPKFSPNKNMPKGHLKLNAMRITEILSDDTNFRSYITMPMTDVLSTLFLLQHEEFKSMWCTPNFLLWEEDVDLEYDPFVAAGWVFDLLSNSPVTRSLKSTYTHVMPQDSYTDQITSLLVKIIANLHCFAPDIYKDEKDMFLHSLFSRLQKETCKGSDGASGIAFDVRKNICSLWTHAESLRINDYLSEEDVQIFRSFVTRLESMITAVDEMLSDLRISECILIEED